MANQVVTDCYTSRRRRLLRDFDRAVGHVRGVFMSRYGEGRTNAMITETRQEYEALIPQLPYIGGKQPFTQFIIFRFKKGGPTRVAVPKSLERARR